MKCPFCAEQIQDEAKVCRFCGKQVAFIKEVRAHDAIGMKITLKIVGIIVLIILSLRFWWLTVPTLASWCLWSKTNISKNDKVILSVITFVLFISLGVAASRAYPAPTITITSPTTVQAPTATIAGKVSPPDSKVMINGNAVAVSASGEFSEDSKVSSEDTKFTIVATASNGRTATVNYSITREFTPEEKQALEEQKQVAEAAQKKAQAAADAKTKADQAAFDSSKAGKLCKQHSDWTKDDCQNVADGKYWIGMTYDMLIASYGHKPNHANPSNYGGGTRWQWCWDDYTPSCFYGGDNGIITSYN